MAVNLITSTPFLNRWFGGAFIKNNVSTTFTGAATITAAQLKGGLIVYTGGAASLTLPTATLLGAALFAIKGTTFDFVVDNSGGSGTVTIVVGTNIVAASALTGGTTLTLANSATVGTANFRITFISATAATIARIQ